MTDRTAHSAPRNPVYKKIRRFGISPSEPADALNRQGCSLAKRSNVAAAFTLVELMISIALVVILILGINTVFKYTAQAVGQGQAIGGAVRDSRSAQTTMANDFAALVPNGSGATDSASLIIASSAQPAFLNAAVKAASVNGNPMLIDLNGNGVEGESTVPGEVVSPATYNTSNHRLDMFSFFARNNFPRQTGNDGTYVDNMSTQEAWIWYGHLWLPSNDQSSQPNAFPANGSAASSKTYPGIGAVATNPNNVYASQFTLGRMVQTLKLASAGAISDPSGAAQYYNSFAAGTNSAMAPLAIDGIATDTAKTPFYQSRYDLAATSIKTIQTQVSTALGLAVPNYNWWCPTVYASTSYSTAGIPPNTTPFLRFQANPFASKPLTAAKMASAAPYLIAGCSQFIVEYAGDFLTQDNDLSHQDTGGGTHSVMGKVTAFGGDGTLDYVMVPPVGNPTAPPSQCTKQIMWYGLPRNTSGRATTNWQNGDTAPVRDILYFDAQSAATGVQIYIPMPANTFEKFSNGPPNLPAYKADYTAAGSNGMSAGDALGGYVAAFGPNDPAPSLIRITMTLNDAAGQLPDGQTYQFVFAVPPQ